MELPSNGLVTLNVGGSLYTTTVSTLTRYPDSMLGAMFSGRMPTSRDTHGHFIIDGDGPIFRHILNFLRRSVLYLPEDFKEWGLLFAEADYYQIKELIDAVTSRREEAKAEVRHKHPGTEMEFIEITIHTIAHELTYRGSYQTITEIPLLYVVFNEWEYDEEADKDIYLKIQQDGWITTTYNSNCPPDRMKMFQEIARLGFQIINTTVSGDNNNLTTWLFGRNL